MCHNKLLLNSKKQLAGYKVSNYWIISADEEKLK